MRKGEYVGRDLYGRVGAGSVRISLNSVNGELAIRRKQDGKTPSPAVNLLPQKSKADESWDNDTSSVSTAKMNREIAKAVKDSQKSVEASVRQSQKELEKIGPELQRINAEAIKEAAKVINAEQIKEEMKAAQVKQKEALARIAEVNWVGGMPSVEKKSDTFKVKGTPKLTVDAKSCSVTIKGWDKPEIQYFITKISKPPQPLKFRAEQRGDSEVNIKVEDTAAAASSAAEGSDAVFGETERTRLEVYVPKKSNLRILSNREIRLENVSGEINVDGGDESVNIRDVDGRLRVATNEGSIRLIGFSGSLESKTVDGSMSLEGSFDKLNAQTVDGMIVLTLPEDADVNIETNQENLESQGFELVKVADKRDASVWKIGKGGSSAYRLYASGDGQALIRCLSNVKVG